MFELSLSSTLYFIHIFSFLCSCLLVSLKVSHFLWRLKSNDCVKKLNINTLWKQILQSLKLNILIRLFFIWKEHWSILGAVSPAQPSRLASHVTEAFTVVQTVRPSQRHKDGEKNKAFTKGGDFKGHPLDCITLEAITGLLGQPSSIAALHRPTATRSRMRCGLSILFITQLQQLLHLSHALISHVGFTTQTHSSGWSSDVFWFPQNISAQHLKLKDTRRYCSITHIWR